MGWKHWDEGKFTVPLIKTGQTITYRPVGLDDDGALELGIAHSFTVLTTGRYSGTVNITVNGKVHATSNACVQDKNTGLMFHREVIQADLGPANDGKFFWEQYTLGPKIDITFTAATKIIHSVAGDFSTTACCIGRKITVSGAAQAGNNQDVTVAAITANNMTVNEAIVNEGAGASVSFASVADTIYDLKNQANANSLAGHTDWRIPNLKELRSLFYLNSIATVIDTTAFPSTPAQHHWTSTTHPTSSSVAYYMHFNGGDTRTSDKKITKYYVRLVR